jgi:hypothetical protein
MEAQVKAQHNSFQEHNTESQTSSEVQPILQEFDISDATT